LLLFGQPGAALRKARHFPNSQFCYNPFAEGEYAMRILEALKPLGLLGLRLGIGLIFLVTGYDKLFADPAKWLVWFSQHNFPSYFSYIAGSLEFFGGILLILGLLTRLIGLLLTIQMAIALAKVSLPPAGFYHAEAYALPLLLCVSCFALATVGAGILSVDAATFERPSRSRARAKA
jgi:putative oxidoreductase